jgi:hypothetical protein
MGPTLSALATLIDSFDGRLRHGDWRTQPPPPTDLPSMPTDARLTPPNPAIPQEDVPGLYRIRAVASIGSQPGPQIGPEVAVMGIPMIATSWGSLLLGLYGYILPFVLYATWVAVAMWDLIRRETESIPNRARWMAVVLLVPFAGPLLYFGFGRSPIPAQLRLMLTAGGVAAYAVFVLLGVVFGG